MCRVLPNKAIGRAARGLLTFDTMKYLTKTYNIFLVTYCFDVKVSLLQCNVIRNLNSVYFVGLSNQLLY